MRIVLLQHRFHGGQLSPNTIDGLVVMDGDVVGLIAFNGAMMTLMAFKPFPVDAQLLLGNVGVLLLDVF